MNLEEIIAYRTGSRSRNSMKIRPSSHADSSEDVNRSLVANNRVVPLPRWYMTQNTAETMHSLFSLVSFSSLKPSCKCLGDSRGIRKVTGTLYGYKRGFVTFAIQEDPKSEPIFLVEFAMYTCTMVKEMSSGLVRIALECKNGSGHGRNVKLLQEPIWTMYCNGKKCGQAVSRSCVESDNYMLNTLQTVSVGAGVVPNNTGGTEGDLIYMRGVFERKVGNHNSEAYYMMNPDGNDGPELMVFLIRV